MDCRIIFSYSVQLDLSSQAHHVKRFNSDIPAFVLVNVNFYNRKIKVSLIQGDMGITEQMNKPKKISFLFMKAVKIIIILKIFIYFRVSSSLTLIILTSFEFRKCMNCGLKILNL